MAITLSITSTMRSYKQNQMEAIETKETLEQVKAFTPNLMVKDVNQTVLYYTNILGFKLVQSFPVRVYLPGLW